MDSLVWKLRISVLWIFLAVSMSAATILWIMTPGSANLLMSGKIELAEKLGMQQTTPEMLLALSIFWVVPLTMAFVTLALRDTLSRYANGVVGSLFALFHVVDATGELQGATFVVALLELGFVIAALAIVWHVWKWPRQAPVERPMRGLAPARP